jgi:hypothetical protein
MLPQTETINAREEVAVETVASELIPTMRESLHALTANVEFLNRYFEEKTALLTPANREAIRALNLAALDFPPSSRPECQYWMFESVRPIANGRVGMVWKEVLEPPNGSIVVVEGEGSIPNIKQLVFETLRV